MRRVLKPGGKLIYIDIAGGAPQIAQQFERYPQTVQIQVIQLSAKVLFLSKRRTS